MGEGSKVQMCSGLPAGTHPAGRVRSSGAGAAQSGCAAPCWALFFISPHGLTGLCCLQLRELAGVVWDGWSAFHRHRILPRNV